MWRPLFSAKYSFRLTQIGEQGKLNEWRMLGKNIDLLIFSARNPLLITNWLLWKQRVYILEYVFIQYILHGQVVTQGQFLSEIQLVLRAVTIV